MNIIIRNLFISVLVLFILIGSPLSASAAQTRGFRFGYLDHPGSALVLLASAKGYFLKEGWHVTLVKYSDSKKGLADLSSGEIDCGAFSLGQTLQEIAKGVPLQIIAGGGILRNKDLLNDLDETALQEQEQQEIVISVLQDAKSLDKTTLIKLVSIFINTYQDISKKPAESWKLISSRSKKSGVKNNISFNPNPDYWRFEKQWQKMGLQQDKTPRDMLATHVYEEIYCDALDRQILKIGLEDPVLQMLFNKAVCAPNCCPAYTGNLSTSQGGVTK